jgi:hypothetical protein
MRHLLLLTLMGAALAGCANDPPPSTAASDSTLTIAPAPVGTVTQVPLAQPQVRHTP